MLGTNNTVVIGPGLGRDANEQSYVEFYLNSFNDDEQKTPKNLVLDADALFYIAQQKEDTTTRYKLLHNLSEARSRCKNVVFTPNLIEFSRI